MSRPVVALATCSTWPDLDDDGPALRSALDRAGIDSDIRVWDDPAVRWSSYDLVVVRTTWDYFQRLPDFLGWAASVPRLCNPEPVVRWNTDKRYLLDLQARGVPVVPTRFLAPGEPFEAIEGEYVVKPSVSAGSVDTVRFGPGEHDPANELVTRLHAEGRHVMVQPYVEAVDDRGETSVLSFGGQVSHAVRKGQILHRGTGVLDRSPGLEVMSRRDASAAEQEVADLAVRAAGRVLGLAQPLLYARVDLVPGPDGPLVLELEVTEPSLFLGFSEGSADRFAAAVRAAIT